MESRSEHLKWAKERALQYVKNGNIADALSSILSDLGKHEKLSDHPAIMLQGSLSLSGHLDTKEEVETFINGIQ